METIADRVFELLESESNLNETQFSKKIGVAQSTLYTLRNSKDGHSKKAIELEPELTYAKANCGLCLLEKGLTDEATEYYLDAADEFKEYGEKEDFQYMIEDLEKAIAKKPDMKGASIILKMLRSKQWW